MKRMGIFHRTRLADGSFEIRDVTGVTLGRAASWREADAIVRELYRQWPIATVTQEYAEYAEGRQ